VPHSPGKFCLDRNLVRWSLLNGIITRKVAADGPQEGRELPVHQVRGIEKTTFLKVERSRSGWLTALFGIAVVVLAWQIDFAPLRLTIGVLGFASVYAGSQKIRPRREVHEAFRLVGPNLRPDEWIVVGSTPEVTGFVEAVRLESEANAQRN
jgi:hypothetical protein